MGEILTKEQVLYLRGKDGELIPQEIELELIEGKPKIKILPITKGEFNEIFTELVRENGNIFWRIFYRIFKKKPRTLIERDYDIIEAHLIEPKLTRKEIENLSPPYMSAILSAIISMSTGMSQREIQESSKDEVKNKLTKKERDFSKGRR